MQQQANCSLYQSPKIASKHLSNALLAQNSKHHGHVLVQEPWALTHLQCVVRLFALGTARRTPVKCHRSRSIRSGFHLDPEARTTTHTWLRWRMGVKCSGNPNCAHPNTHLRSVDLHHIVHFPRPLACGFYRLMPSVLIFTIVNHFHSCLLFLFCHHHHQSNAAVKAQVT